jgi:hypothetical protein
MKIGTWLTRLTLTLTIATSVAMAAETAILRNEGRTATVTADTLKNRLTVHLRPTDGTLPPTVEIALRTQTGELRVYELRTVTPRGQRQSHGARYTGSWPSPPTGEQGSDVAGQQSLVGAELRIPLTTGGSETLR